MTLPPGTMAMTIETITGVAAMAAGIVAMVTGVAAMVVSILPAVTGKPAATATCP